MLKDDEFFSEMSNSPNPSVTDEESNAWDCQHHETWSCCEWNSVPTLCSHIQTCFNKPWECSHISFFLSVTFRDEPKVLVSFLFFQFLSDGFVNVYSPVATFTPELYLRYCRMVTEGTFGATPLLACQLVSGDILYSVMYWQLSFRDRTEASTSTKMTSRKMPI